MLEIRSDAVDRLEDENRRLWLVFEEITAGPSRATSFSAVQEAGLRPAEDLRMVAVRDSPFSA